MIEVRTTPVFDRWLARLRDQRAKQRIQIRLRRVSLGNVGDIKPVGDGVSELRIDYGPGYRVYCLQRGETVVILLCGGDKSTQNRDIERARSLAAQLQE